jgi:hypothetical protein
MGRRKVFVVVATVIMAVAGVLLSLTPDTDDGYAPEVVTQPPTVGLLA